MSQTEAAWMAGLFDGEGGVYGYAAKGRYKAWTFNLPNTYRPALERCQQIAGCGKIDRKTPHRSNRKESWVYRISAREDIAAVLRQLLPYLVIKKESAEDFLKAVI
jgi:hypothetical protein